MNADLMDTVLLISDVSVDSEGGRAAKFKQRKEKLADEGVRIIVAETPEPYIPLFPYAIIKCIFLSLWEDIDIVNSVNNPFHLHLVGYIVSRILGVPWVAEFRDPLLEIPERDPESIFTKMASIVERLCVHKATRVLWWDGIQISDDYFKTRYPDAIDLEERFEKLPFTGYETEIFEEADPDYHDEFTITYAGSFYEGWIEPVSFLRSVGRYIEENGEDDLTVHFYGDWDESYTDIARSVGAEDVIETHDFIPLEELAGVLKGSDVLLYVGGDDERNRLNVPSKIYDYVGAGRPILAIVNQSFRAAKLIEENGLGIVVEPGDIDGITNALSMFHKNDFTYRPNPELLHQFQSDSAMERLREIYSDLAGK